MDPLVFTCYEKIMELKASVSTGFYPNTMIAVINKVANGNPTLQQQLSDYSKQCVKPGHEYVIDKFI